MIYICSDIHGLYDRYIRLLDTIQLKDTDTLYVLGDAIDRGPDGIRILQDMMQRRNVEFFMGNHEHMMLMYLFGFDPTAWMLDCNGGKTTFEDFRQLSETEQAEIISYLNSSWIVKILKINGKRYSLSHIGIIDTDTDKRADFLSKETDVRDLQKMVWGMSPYDLEKILSYPEELCPTVFVTGHIVTRRYSFGFDEDDVVYSDFDNGCRYVDIDCGCALSDGSGALSCLKLDEETGILDLDHPLYIR